jgi:hydrogenase maturation protease
MDHRMLVAGVGNIFLGDDGFGVEVVRRLAGESLPEWVRVADFGIRGIHLAYELLDTRYETTVLVDATPRGRAPGTVYLIEPDLEASAPAGGEASDAHGMNPAAVFGLLRKLGGTAGRVLIVGCEPARTDEEIGLSEPVARAVDDAVRLTLELINGQPA